MDAKQRFEPLPRVTIGAVVVPVYLEPGDELHGWYSSMPEQSIHICQQEESSLYRTVLHEALHAVADLYGIGLSERDVQVLENVLSAFLRDNPALVEKIQELGRRA